MCMICYFNLVEMESKFCFNLFYKVGDLFDVGLLCQDIEVKKSLFGKIKYKRIVCGFERFDVVVAEWRKLICIGILCVLNLYSIGLLW